MIEYHIPKLGRTKLAGAKNNSVEPFKVQLVRYVPKEINKRIKEMIGDETAS